MMAVGSSAAAHAKHAARRARLVDQLAAFARSGTGSDAGADDVVRVVRAPGRVNLIGEHTDYNLGYVMPAAINLETWIASRPREDTTVRILSLQEDEAAEFDVVDVGPPRGTWIDYLCGVAQSLGSEGVPLRGVEAVIDSEIPLGAGLSSSAALELAAAWTLATSAPPPLEPMALARAAQRAENHYVRVNSGLMDQFASTHGQTGAALLFDCRSLDFQAVPIPAGYRLVAIDTRSPHKLGSSEYNARRAECERGVALIAEREANVESLRDVTTDMLDRHRDVLDDTTLRRCRHVVEENARVLQAADALRSGDLARVGRLFAASHASLRDLYEVTSPELDALVEIASAVRGVVGARMTGGGFGGCTVNLVRDDAVDALRDAVDREYPARTGREAGYHVVETVDGAGLVRLP